MTQSSPAPPANERDRAPKAANAGPPPGAGPPATASRHDDDTPTHAPSAAAGAVAVAAAGPTAPASPPGPPTQLGRYQIVRLLGQGAMGSVYLAEDTVLQRRVALKVPKVSSPEKPHLLERFYREARAAATLRHPNICAVHDLGEDQGTRFITMGYVSGPPLSQLVGSEKLRSARTVVRLVRKLALALAEAHAKGIVHRDLKPGNILLDERNEPVITDFGLARRMDEADESRLTQDGMLLGTPAYMAPEQVSADPEQIGPACDVYALGVILYELLTGQPPYRGPLAAVLGQIVQGKPRRPSELRPDLDPRLEMICLKMMAASPTDRFASAAEAATALTRWLEQTGAALQASQMGPLPKAASQPSARPAEAAPPSAAPGAKVAPAPAADVPRRLQPGEPIRVGQDGKPLPAAARVRSRRRFRAFRVGLIAGAVLLGLLAAAYAVRTLVWDARERPPAPPPVVTKDPPAPPEATSPFVAATPREQQEAWATSLGVPTELTNAVNMRLTLIPPGEFEMGASDSAVAQWAEEARAARPPPWYADFLRSEAAAHRVRITKPFFVAVQEVTQRQYHEVMRPKPGLGPRGEPMGLLPMEGVSWEDAQEFCKRLSERPLEQAAGRRYRLPTEAEWEYACRVGTASRYFFGDQSAALGDYAWHLGNSGQRAHPVGRKKPNDWGLCDVYGNVWEWCQDWYDAHYYGQFQSQTAVDPPGPASGTARVLRGGSGGEPPQCLRSTVRYAQPPTARVAWIGFRVALDARADDGRTPGAKPARPAEPPADAPRFKFKPARPGNTSPGAKQPGKTPAGSPSPSPKR